MLYLKNVYLYFSSIKKLFLKSIKELFFSTNFYNKLLISKNPSRFFFYPNPYLLSSLINHKSFVFKISETEINNFWSQDNGVNNNKNIHNFLWLNLIDRKTEVKVVQKILNDWIRKYGNYRKDVWSPKIVGNRVISWISNGEMILSNSSNDFENSFFRYLVKQVNFLKKNFNTFTNDKTKITSISAIVISGLVFKEYFNNYTLGLQELKNIIEEYFDKDGFPKNRNFENLITFLQYFILIKEWIKNGQEIVPDYLESIIEKNLICLNSLVNSSKKVPLFNGVTEKNLEDFIEYLNKLNYRFDKNLISVGKIQIIKNKKASLYFDSGDPPNQHLSKDYQSGPLSFEYFNEGDKIITNCGYGRKISKKTRLISKFTSAQSTLCIDNTSVVKFKRNSLINSIYGSTIDSSFKIFDTDRSEDKKNITISATHNAYLKRFGYLHKRTIKFCKKNNEITGTDSLIKKNGNSANVNFSIRFHIYPGIDAIQTVSGKSILLQINKKKSLVFLTNNDDVEIEKSLFLGGNKVLNNQCVVIYGDTKSQDRNIEWKLKKAS